MDAVNSCIVYCRALWHASELDRKGQSDAIIARGFPVDSLQRRACKEPVADMLARGQRWPAPRLGREKEVALENPLVDQCQNHAAGRVAPRQSDAPFVIYPS